MTGLFYEACAVMGAVFGVLALVLEVCRDNRGPAGPAGPPGPIGATGAAICVPTRNVGVTER